MKTYGLIGFPLAHSFSEKYFSEKFRNESIKDCVYKNFPISSVDKLPEVLADTSLKGLNVTIPYKEQVITYLDELDPVAMEIGAVNTIKVVRSENIIRLKGYNTDADGFLGSLQNILDFNPDSALILGTGGASKAIVYVLNRLGIKSIKVSRNPATGDLAYNELTPDVIRNNLLIINTTPLGTYPGTENYPDIPYHLLTDRHLLFDLIYNPPETKFLKFGKGAGAKTVNGYGMLIRQAEESWKIWNE